MMKFVLKLNVIVIFFLLCSWFNPSSTGAGTELEYDLLYSLDEFFEFDGDYDHSNGILGIVYRDDSDRSIVYKEIDGSKTTEEVVSSSASSYIRETMFLVFDSQSEPHLFISSTRDEIEHFYRNNVDSGAEWINETIFTLDRDAFPSLSNKIVDVEIGSGDSFHIICSYDYSIFYISNKDGSWDKTPQIVDELSEDHVNIEFGWRISIMGKPDMVLDGSDKAHVAYSTLYETRYITNGSGVWIAEDVYRDTNMDYWPAANPSIAVDGEGNPAIVGSEMDHATTGSIQYSKLKYLTRKGAGDWESTTLVDRADGYSGNDGTNFTGVNARLMFDNMNSPHILFSDHASSHNEMGYNYVKDGQIRYASNNSGNWTISTIYSQSPDNAEMIDLWFDISFDGEEIRILGQEVLRVGDVYSGYDSETYNLLYFHPEYTAPVEPVPDIRANGSDGPLYVTFGETVSFEISLDSGDYKGEAADWWLVKYAPDERMYYYDPLLFDWVETGSDGYIAPAYQGALFDLTSTAIFSTDNPDEGLSIFFFAIDLEADGSINETIYYDSIEVIVSGL